MEWSEPYMREGIRNDMFFVTRYLNQFREQYGPAVLGEAVHEVCCPEHGVGRRYWPDYTEQEWEMWGDILSDPLGRQDVDLVPNPVRDVVAATFDRKVYALALMQEFSNSLSSN